MTSDPRRFTGTVITSPPFRTPAESSRTMQRKHIPLILGTVFLAACGQGPDTDTTETTTQAPATETPAVAAATAIMTQFTASLSEVEPVLVVVNGFISYILADYLSVSGIFAIMFYGIGASRWVDPNLSAESLKSTQLSIHAIGDLVDEVPVGIEEAAAGLQIGDGQALAAITGCLAPRS